MAKSPSHGRDMGEFYLIFWRRNYPHDRGTRPNGLTLPHAYPSKNGLDTTVSGRSMRPIPTCLTAVSSAHSRADPARAELEHQRLTAHADHLLYTWGGEAQHQRSGPRVEGAFRRRRRGCNR